MTVTPWLANYPFSDPYFQNFNVQQYLTVSGVNPTQTYALEAPVEDDEIEAPEPEAKAKAPRKVAAKPADKTPEDK
jgi:hypothetical protein